MNYLYIFQKFIYNIKNINQKIFVRRKNMKKKKTNIFRKKQNIYLTKTKNPRITITDAFTNNCINNLIEEINKFVTDYYQN